MKMLRYLGLMVLVVCLTAFASGCGGGGGGGGTADEEMTPVMECPQGQIGTYPACMDPPPTDEQRIEAALGTLAGIIADARTRVGAAQSDANAVQSHADATEAQKTSAGNLGDTARDALTDILGASAAANVATTGAQAEAAVSDAQTALNDLISAQQSVASILSAVNAIADLRRQQEQDERLATNGSSLIKHVRDNSLVYDAILAAMTADAADNMTVGATNDSNTMATYPKDTGTGTTRVVGERGVTLKGLSSNSTTPKLSGTGRLPYGFDLKNDTNTVFVNAYTDITKTRANVRTRTNVVEDTSGAPDDGTTDLYENRDFPDTDYLLAGIWIENNAIHAFAYGSEEISTSAENFCVGIEGSGVTGTTTRTCGTTDNLNEITGFVAEDKDMTATYRGDANGAYLASGAMSYFEADVTLTAEFQNAANSGSGSISGAVTNIVAGGKSIAGSIELQEHTFGNTIEAAFEGVAVGVVAGKSYSGAWEGQFFDMRVNRSSQTTRDTTQDPVTTTITTTYSAQAPGSVAGTFYATQQSAPAGSAAFIGAFAAKR